LKKRRGSRGRPQKDRGNGSSEILKVEKGVWEGGARENANKEDLRSCHRSQGDV